MLRRKEWLAWLAVVLWALLIFATVPLARGLQRWVADNLGRAIFTQIVLVVLLVSLGAFAVKVWRSAHSDWRNLLWLVLVAGVFVVLTLNLRDNPEEAIHFLEFGALGALSFVALSHRIRDPSIYIAAAGVTCVVGILDEGLQWVVRDRIWDLRDLWINLSAGVLALLAIAKGLAPAAVAPPVRPRGIRLSCRIWSAAVLLLLASLLNTPERINAYVERFPILGFLQSNASVMAEYGYLYSDPLAGVFRSRFAPGELQAVDAERALEAARLLDASEHERLAFREFIRIHSPLSDPFVHEARVRLYRRQYHLERARRYDEGHPLHAHHMAVVHHENLIMERYFTNTLNSSRYVLEPQLRASLERYAQPGGDYESPVSKKLITRLDELGMAALLTAALLALLIVDVRYGRD